MSNLPWLLDARRKLYRELVYRFCSASMSWCFYHLLVYSCGCMCTWKLTNTQKITWQLVAEKNTCFLLLFISSQVLSHKQHKKSKTIITQMHPGWSWEKYQLGKPSLKSAKSHYTWFWTQKTKAHLCIRAIYLLLVHCIYGVLTWVQQIHKHTCMHTLSENNN